MSKRKRLFVILLSILLFSIGIICLLIVYPGNAEDETTDTESIYVKDEESTETEETELAYIESEENLEAETIETETPETQMEDTEGVAEETTEIETEESDAEPIEVSEDTFVKVKNYIPDIEVELKYAGTDNFTGQMIYEFTDAYLRYGTVKKLMKVQDALRENQLSLKIWDAFRPVSAQFVLWEICPDSTYVANPYKGFSSHSRGNTVDITVVDASGKELTMPTGFDDFSTLADRDYSDCTEEAKKNALLLEHLMTENGFKGYSGEWWHFSDVVRYSVEEEFQP